MQLQLRILVAEWGTSNDHVSYVIPNLIEDANQRPGGPLELHFAAGSDDEAGAPSGTKHKATRTEDAVDADRGAEGGGSAPGP